MSREVLRRGLVALATAVAVGLLVLVAVVRFGGDGGDDDTPGGASPTPTTPGEEFDGCEVVGRVEAQKILGEVPRRGLKSTEQFTATNCTWEAVAGGGARNLQFSAYRGHHFYGGEVLDDDPTYEKVEGVGDGAFSLEPEGSVQLQFLAGDFTVVLSVNGLDAGPELDKEKVKKQVVALGKRVASKLD